MTSSGVLSLPKSGNSPRLFAGSNALVPHAAGTAESLYIHVPFCFHKCHYCDFYSIVDTRDRQEAFAARLCKELSALAPHARVPLETIFVGGGTPSLLRSDLWIGILRHMAELFDLTSLREFTVECNPETVTRELMDVYVAGGVTRVSMGAQSFNPSHLKTLERWHNPENVSIALSHAKRAGIQRQSLDLIFGVPGQTISDWEEDLSKALSLETEHLSCYGLTYEAGTAMTARLNRGDVEPMDDELEAQLFDITQSALEKRGLLRYEISNFARPGAECQHNLIYWRQGNWLAAGPSASGHVRGLRWKNTARLDDYLTFEQGGYSPISEAEPPDALRNCTELLMTTLRLREGVILQSLDSALALLPERARTGFYTWAQRAERAGLAQRSNDTFALTQDGLRIANTLILQAAEAVDTEQ